MNTKSYIAIIIVLLVFTGFGLFLFLNNESGIGGREEDTGDTGDNGTTTIPISVDLGDGVPVPDIYRSLPDDVSQDIRDEIEVIQRGLENDNFFYTGWLDLASYRKIVGDFEGARDIWLFVADRWPTEIAAFINLGDLYRYDIKNNERSEDNYERVILLRPDYVDGYIRLHELYTHDFAKKKKEADDILLEGLKQNPDDMALLARLGEYYEAEGDEKKAKKYYLLVSDEADKNGDIETKNRFLEKANAL